MDLSLARDRFATLACSEQRSLMARFRDVFEFVDGAISAGVSRVAARDELAALGLDLKLNTFIVFLRRLRKERAASKPVAPHSRPQTRNEAQPPAQPAVVVRSAVHATHTVARQKVTLPDDWLTGPITPEQARMLTPEQKLARRKARDEKYFPNPYKKPS
jgi:hypothetical protein